MSFVGWYAAKENCWELAQALTDYFYPNEKRNDSITTKNKILNKSNNLGINDIAKTKSKRNK